MLLPVPQDLSSSCPLLVGNSFPWALVERALRAGPATDAALRERIASAGPDGLHSFWGHASTLPVASDFAGTDLTPRTVRPAVTLSDDGLPMLNGITFQEAWIISPGFRPAENAAAAAEDIERWQVLRLIWES